MRKHRIPRAIRALEQLEAQVTAMPEAQTLCVAGIAMLEEMYGDKPSRSTALTLDHAMQNFRRLHLLAKEILGQQCYEVLLSKAGTTKKEGGRRIARSATA